jgi:hypothetical protein
MQLQKAPDKIRRRLPLIGGALAIVAIAVFLFGKMPSAEHSSRSAPLAAPVAGASKHATEQGAAKTPVIGANGMVIFIDPQTGQPREGTPEEYQALAAGRSIGAGQSTGAGAAPIPFQTQDGIIGVRLPESFDTSVVATRNPDGSVSFSEVTSNPKAPSSVGAGQGVSTAQKEVANDR